MVHRPERMVLEEVRLSSEPDLSSRQPRQPMPTRWGLINWLEFGTLVAILGLLALALGGLVLAMLGWFHVVPVAIVSLAILLALLRIWSWAADTAPYRGGLSDARISLVLLMVVGLATAVNAKYSSEHLFLDRDPGVYVTTARWLTTDGSLLVDAGNGVFEAAGALELASPGYYDSRGDGKLYPQFLHALPVVLAAAWWVGGSWLMFKTTAVLSGLALLAFFALGRRVVAPWLALIAVGALAVNLVQVYFARDAYTEILTQVFLFGGLWALMVAREPMHSGRALLAGLLFGAAAMTRIDALMYLAPLGTYLMIELWTSGAVRTTVRNNYAAPVAAGAAIAGGLAWLDLRFFSPDYLANLQAEVTLALLAVGSIVGVWLLGLLLQPKEWFVRLLRRQREAIGLGLAVLIVVGAVALYVVRPHIQKDTVDAFIGPVAQLQQREGLDIEPDRLYSEFSLRWLGWYLGLPALGLGLLGWAWSSRQAVLGGMRRLLPFLLIFSMVTIVYLWKPTITPDHLWAMRRFLPVTIPGLLLLGVWTLDQLRGRTVWHHIPARWLMAVAVGSLILPAAIFTAPLVTADTQMGLLSATRRICESIPGHSAVVVRGESLGRGYPPTLRSFCGVPAAVLPVEVSPRGLPVTARSLQQRGLDLYLMGEGRFASMCGIREPDAVFDFDYHLPEPTLTRRPSGLETRSFQATLTKIEPGLGHEVPARAHGLFFDGVDDHAQISPSEFLDLDQALVVEFDLATRWRPPTSSSAMVSKGRYPGAWWFEYRPDGSLEFYAEVGGSVRRARIPAGLVDDGRLHHIAGVYDGSSMAVYCDGSLMDASPAAGELTTNDEPLLIGTAFGSRFARHPFRGFIDGVQVGRVGPSFGLGWRFLAESVIPVARWDFEELNVQRGDDAHLTLYGPEPYLLLGSLREEELSPIQPD